MLGVAPFFDKYASRGRLAGFVLLARMACKSLSPTLEAWGTLTSN